MSAAEPLRVPQLVKRQSLPERVARELHALIAGGTYAAGAQLPHQRVLAQQFGVSTAVVRESLALLTAAGLIWSRAGQGTFVTDQPDAALRYPAWVRPPAGPAELEEAIDAREVLERAIARLAAERHADGDVERLRECVGAMAAHAENAQAFAQADLDFHLALAEAAHNRLLAGALAGFQRLLHAELVLRAERAIAAGTVSSGVAHHSALVDAIEVRDAAGAEAEIDGMLERARAAAMDSQA
jgi:GntR family transcriptional repressor for pyruvate dehydrogenase complex